LRIEAFSLSNFHRCLVVYEGILFKTTEHAFQAAKTFDKKARLKIAYLPSPRKAKIAGRKVILREDWEQVKDAVMYDILKLKFSQPYFEKKLPETGKAQLVEGNTWNDTYWGVCNGEGKNKLGVILMKIREELESKNTTHEI
jgi:ribA/ribD-fused uncharacterized protein